MPEHLLKHQFKKGQPKMGGRKKGTPNKVTSAKRRLIEASGQMPLDYLIQVMRDIKNSTEVRKDAAAKAAPYLHPKLQTVEVSGPDKGPIETREVTDAERAKALAVFIARTKGSLDKLV